MKCYGWIVTAFLYLRRADCGLMGGDYFDIF